MSDAAVLSWGVSGNNEGGVSLDQSSFNLQRPLKVVAPIIVSVESRHKSTETNAFETDTFANARVG